MEKDAQRGARLEEKATRLTAGLVARATKLTDTIDTLQQDVAATAMEKRCFEVLQEHEQRTAPLRLAGLREVVEVQRQREGALQDRYKKLMATRADLLAA